MNVRLVRLRADRAASLAAGLCSVCSSHPDVLAAAVRLAGARGEAVLVEATANQVNQYGGYTGLTPASFAEAILDLCAAHRVDPSLVVLGGDHLGPYPWRDRDAPGAMREAETLVRCFVRAGVQKIHLDASMPLGGDPLPALPPHLAAARAAALCAAAEDEWRKLGSERHCAAPAYVIGTEVPVPGGGGAGEAPHAPVPTRGEDFHETVALHRRLFSQSGLDAAWERVIAVVVQPGVEFDRGAVYPYRRENAAALSLALSEHPGLCFECHSTDYQPTSVLHLLVEDGFAILKVGPELTFCLREALFGLASIEEELLGGAAPARASVRTSGLKAAVLDAMRGDPRHWKGYYPEDESLPFSLTYSYSDRMRYYWNYPPVAAAVARLFANLGRTGVPPQLVSQYLPHLPCMPDLDATDRAPRDLLRACVSVSLQRFMSACAPVAGRSSSSHGGAPA